MAFRLINAEDIKALTKGDFGTTYDSLLNDIIIPEVGELFAAYCRRPDFDLKSRTELHSPHENQRRVYLKSPPVSISPAVQVWESGDVPRDYGATELLVNGQDYFVFNDEGVIEKVSPFLKGAQTIQVTYTGGYLTGDAQGVPPGLRLAAMIQCKGLFDRREELSVTGRSLEGGSLSMLAPLILSTAVTMILDRYKVPRT